jgi:trehalose/maltose hydrolase-like predicted phosphorylase
LADDVAVRVMEPTILDRTFEAVVFDWDGTAVPDRQADASAVRRQVEDLTRAGVHVVVVSGTHVGNIDGQLHARPVPPGSLHLCLNRGSEVFVVDDNGPRLAWRRETSPLEEAGLDAAAARTIELLGARGLTAEVVSQRVNRRKVDLIPEPEWHDPPKAMIDNLLAAVDARLRATGIAGLPDVVAVAIAAAREVGIPDPRVTSDVKHVEVGLTDKSDSMRWVLDHLRRLGIGPGLVLVAGDEFGPLGDVQGSDAFMLVPQLRRAAVISVGVEPGGVPEGVFHAGGGPARFAAMLDDQLTRRAGRRVPSIDEDPDWTLFLDDDRALRRTHESLCTMANGRFGTRGAREEDGHDTTPLVVASGIYTGRSAPRLLAGPRWDGLLVRATDGVEPDRVAFDLRTGVLVRERRMGAHGQLRTMRFASLAQPEAMALRAEGPSDAMAGGPHLAPPDENELERGDDAEVHWARTRSTFGGGITAAAVEVDDVVDGRRRVERIAAYSAHRTDLPAGADLVSRARELATTGFDRLLAQQRAAWARRWEAAEIAIEGDPDAELAARFAIHHLLASVAGDGEAAVGARGLSGPAYGGHVFWDTDVFVVPALAAIHPQAARAVLQYRIRQLPDARRVAAALGRSGARFAWETAHDGTDVTPRSTHDTSGALVPILTGQHEEHIVADVAWAAWQYARWAGDATFLSGEGRDLLVETARYWVSRARLDAAGHAHLYGVIGPDEYHGPVDDNAFTNVMARWNLRRAAELIEAAGHDEAEAAGWRAIADALVDGYDADTGRYEQFAGYSSLEPLLIAEFADPPVVADVLLGARRVSGSQIIKQADVLMLHHLVPEEVVPGSLVPNLDYYGPRTAHGSSLSPAIQAAVLARAGRADEALKLFRLACRLDRDDLTGTTAGGLHLATLGGVWQALVFGFAGVRLDEGGVIVDPHLPREWRALEVRLRPHGIPIRLRITPTDVEIQTELALALRLERGPAVVVQPPGGQIALPQRRSS